MVQISKIDVARVKLQSQNPFFSYLIKTTPLIERNDTPTAATNGEVIYYNSKFINSLDTNTAIFALCHEMWHIISEHVQSREWRDPEIWQYVVDVSTNNTLFNCQFKIWDKAIMNREYDGWSVFKIYEDIISKQKTTKGGYPLPGKDGLGKDLLPGNNQVNSTQISKIIKDKVVTAATIAKMAGQNPAGLEQFLDDILAPKVNWRDLLYRYLLETTKSRLTWSVPNQRYAGNNIILPSKQNKDVGDLVIVADTSGSMVNVLSQIGGMIKDVAAQLKPKHIRIIWADDTDCAGEQVFAVGQTLDFKPIGGGGTDMRKPLKYVEKYNPLACVLFTDGYTPWPENVPYPLIICSTTNQVSPIGKTIYVKI